MFHSFLIHLHVFFDFVPNRMKIIPRRASRNSTKLKKL